MQELGELLQGKKALITGASKGIGRAISLAYAENGANLCLVSRKGDEVESLAKEIESRGKTRALALQGDVSDPAKAADIPSRAIQLLGGIDILVCAAGYPFSPELWNKPLHDYVDEDLLKVFNTDLMGSFRVAKGVIPEMMKQKSGVVILFSSTPAISGYDKGGSYTITKSAVRSLAKEIASEYAEHNIRAYAIAPGNIKTDSTFNNLSQADQLALAQESPMKRWGTPEEIGNVCVVLASNNMTFVTGQTIVVDGGTIML